MKQPDSASDVMDSDLADAIVAHDRARRRREAAEAAEAGALQRLIVVAEDAGCGGPREVARLAGVAPATVTRHKARWALRPGRSKPGAHYDEDEYVAARDALWVDVPGERVDRGPWRVEWTADGALFSEVSLGTAYLNLTDGTSSFDPSTGESLRGITEAEYMDLRDHGADTVERGRVARRLARAVLRTVHPAIERTATVVDVALPKVLADVPRAYAIIVSATDEAIDDEHRTTLRTARSSGIYLGLADQR